MGDRERTTPIFKDCTHLLDIKGVTPWPGGHTLQRCPFRTVAKDGYANEVLVFGCDSGTHMDSPAHFFDGKQTISDLDVRNFVAPGVVIDVSEKCVTNADYTLTVGDIEAWESKHGGIPDGALVCMRCGWEPKFPDVKAYQNFGSDGKMHFPGFAAEAATFLLKQRAIVGIGIDTLSLDPGNSEKFEVHCIVLGAGKYQIENMVLANVPPVGITFFSLPLKIEAAPESPTRIAAMIMGAGSLQFKQVVDCTHSISRGCARYPNGQDILTCPFRTVKGDGFSKNVYIAGADTGTHIDSPSHFFDDARTITDLQMEQELVVPGVVIDVSQKCVTNADYTLTVGDIEAWESKHGGIPDGALVCMRCGWEPKFPDVKAYQNFGSDGKMHFPGFGAEAATFLLKQRAIVGIGIDTLSLDPGNSEKFEVHCIVLGAGKYQIENMVLSNVPPVSAWFAALSMKVNRATEMMCRCVALVP